MPAAHACRNESHLRAFQRGCDLVAALFCAALANLRVRAGTAPLGKFGAKLNLLRRLRGVQGLLVRIHADELHAAQAAGNHPVHRVAAAATNTYHFDISDIFIFYIQDESHRYSS